MGVLRKGFTVNTTANIKIKIPRNTVVQANETTVFFRDFPLRIHWIETNRAFFAEFGGELFRIVFPDKNKLENPYPLSMIRRV